MNYVAIQKLLANELFVLESEYRMFHKEAMDAYPKCDINAPDDFWFRRLNHAKSQMRKNKAKRINIVRMLKGIKCLKRLQSMS